MAAKAGILPDAKALTAENIYTEIITANAQMDDAEVPASDRVLILTPTAYTLLKQSKATFDNQDIGAEHPAVIDRLAIIGQMTTDSAHTRVKDNVRKAGLLHLPGG